MMTEAQFRRRARPHILRCRSGDWRHALRVVRWVTRLGGTGSGSVLIRTAGYIHDIGWRDVLPRKKLTLDQLLRYERRANRNSTTFSAELLVECGFSTGEVRTVHRLIAAADAHRASRRDEAILTDADQLSKLSLSHVREKFQRSEWRRVATLWRREFPHRIATAEGKRLWYAAWEKLDRALRRAGV